MITGVRRPEEASGLGLSRRLLVRIGALLKKRLAVSLPVLESAQPGSPMEALLLDPAVLEHGGILNARTLKVLSKGHPPDAPLLALADAADGIRVLCLQEELDVPAGWIQPRDAANERESSPLAVAGQRGAQAPRRASGDAAATPDLNQLRLKLATASAPGERSEALRILLFAPLASGEKAEILLHGLADPDASVRAEAARLLPELGVDPSLADALAALNHDDPAKRIAAAERLYKLTGNSPAKLREVEAAAIAVCSISTLKAGAGAALAEKLLELLQVCAPLVGRNPARLAEVLRVLSELLSATAKRAGASSAELETLLSAAHRLAAALGRAEPEHFLAALCAERERSTDAVTEGFCLQSILDLIPAGAQREDEWISFCAQYLARDTEEGRDSRSIGARLAPRGDKALLALCEVFQSATPGAQRHALLLLDEICRLNKVAPTSIERAAGILLQILAGGGKALRMAAMECRFAADVAISEGTRTKLAREFLKSADDFTFSFDIEKVESTLSHMGLAGLEPMLENLAPEYPVKKRIRAVRLLGETALNMTAPRGQLKRIKENLTEVLRRLRALSLDAAFPDRGELLCALGKAAACPALSREADEVITRALLEGARGSDTVLKARALEGLSFIATSRRASADLTAVMATLLRHELVMANTNVEASEKTLDDGKIIEITGDAQYTTLLPAVLKGIKRLASSCLCPPATLRELAALLLEQWQKLTRGEMVWGPGNTLLLIEGLKETACQPRFPPDLRMEIIKALAPKHRQPPIMQALSEILESCGSAATAGAALAIGNAILGRRDGSGQFAREERGEILKALARIARRKYLNAGPGAAFRRAALEELFKGLKDKVPGAYESLASLRDSENTPKLLHEEIERRLKEYHGFQHCQQTPSGPALLYFPQSMP